MERGTHHGEGGTGTIGCKYEKKNRLEMPRGLKDQDHKASRGEQGNVFAILISDTRTQGRVSITPP